MGSAASSSSEPLTVGVVAAEGPASRVAEDLARDLGVAFSGSEWRTHVDRVGHADPAIDVDALVQAVRRSLADADRDLAIGLFDLPLTARRRPVSASHGALRGSSHDRGVPRRT
jgi:hypothetical protein